MKFCKKCNLNKEKIEFHKDKTTKDGLNFYCKKCTRIKNRIVREKSYIPKIRCHQTNRRIIKERHIYYLAGIIEGEGCITKDKGFVSIAVEMSDEDVIRRLQQLSGMGSVTGPRYRKNIKWKPMWVWRVRARQDTVRLMLILYPILSDRRKNQIEIALDHLFKLHKSTRNKFNASMKGNK